MQTAADQSIPREHRYFYPKRIPTLTGSEPQTAAPRRTIGRVLRTYGRNGTAGYTMKACILRKHNVSLEGIELVDLPDPGPGTAEVLIRVQAASLNYRDYLIVTNNY